MSNRTLLQSTTMLSGLVGCTFLAAGAAWAADLQVYTKAPKATLASTLDPAVDGVNGKLDGYGGSIASMRIFGVNGSLSLPVSGQYGVQFDGNIGSLDSSKFAAGAGHWFWRNPSQMLVGVYASETYWDRFGGVDVTQVAGEGEYYLGKFTVQGIAGVEFGNSVSSSATSTSIVPPGTQPCCAGGTPGVATTTTFSQGYDIKTRFFDQINLKYYFDDNFSAYVGHRYLGGENALALGGELATPLGKGLMASAFVEGRVGEDNFRGVWGGLKLYFGQSDKPLIARHRRDDPPNWTTDTLFSILNNNTSSSSSTSSHFCTAPRTLQANGNCEQTFFASDCRLKRDIALLTRLENGIGIYRYRYLWSDTVYVGVMAQEVASVDPLAAAHAADGFMHVNYARLGLRLLTWNEWQAGKNIRPIRLAA
jgi:hypothetical protein